METSKAVALPDEVSQALVVGEMNLFAVLRQAFVVIDELRERTSDPVALAQVGALLDGANRELATIRKSVVKDLYAAMPERKMVVPGVGEIERTGGTTWSESDWSHEVINDAVVSKVEGEEPEGGLHEFGLAVIAEYRSLLSSPKYKSTSLEALIPEMGIESLFDIGERKDGTPGVRIPRLKGT